MKKFPCRYCQKKFRNAQARENHIRSLRTSANKLLAANTVTGLPRITHFTQQEARH